jgi:hypothetical protein
MLHQQGVELGLQRARTNVARRLNKYQKRCWASPSGDQVVMF